jgi:hypothetical protein
VYRYALDDSDDEEEQDAPRAMEAGEQEERAAAVPPCKSQARYGLSDSDDENVCREPSAVPVDSRMRHEDAQGGWTPSFARAQSPRRMQQSSPAYALPTMLGLDPSSMQVRRRCS